MIYDDNMKTRFCWKKYPIVCQRIGVKCGWRSGDESALTNHRKKTSVRSRTWVNYQTRLRQREITEPQRCLWRRVADSSKRHASAEVSRTRGRTQERFWAARRHTGPARRRHGFASDRLASARLPLVSPRSQRSGHSAAPLIAVNGITARAAHRVTHFKISTISRLHSFLRPSLRLALWRPTNTSILC